ncbi:MAG: FAD-dependent oxidoreductase [Herpetosiphonaceae bacterium]|nr:MAG: FAD-dependent oxidoreductase [Herpetosiphonaceae bacterium]
MASTTANLVICGAGMAGVAAAYHLAVRQGIKNLVLVDERPPLTLTSDKGTQAYRNWWPGPGDTMVRFMNRSIDLLEELASECNNSFRLNRRGYVFLTADEGQIPHMRRTAEEICALGAGPLRIHPGPEEYNPSPPEGFEGLPAGADLLLDRALIRQQFPFITDAVIAMLHVRRCGWFNAPRLGAWLLEQAQRSGVRLLRDRVVGVETAGGRVQTVRLQSGARIDTGAFVIAAGPYLRQVGALLELDIPVFNELHGKMAFEDDLGVVPPSAPLMIWNDPLYLPWSEEERRALAARAETRRLLEQFPAGVHFRPRDDGGKPTLLIIWTYDTHIQEPVWPPQFDPHYAEVLLRGLGSMIPGLAAYFGQGARGYVDGGYYCKTRENRPLIGPLPVEGAYVIGALSGYGVMASQAAAELLAAHVTGASLPDYAPAFLIERYKDPAYQALLDRWDALSGQL